MSTSIIFSHPRNGTDYISLPKCTGQFMCKFSALKWPLSNSLGSWKLSSIQQSTPKTVPPGTETGWCWDESALLATSLLQGIKHPSDDTNAQAPHRLQELKHAHLQWSALPPELKGSAWPPNSPFMCILITPWWRLAAMLSGCVTARVLTLSWSETSETLLHD